MLFEADLVDEKARHQHVDVDLNMRVMKEASLARAAANQFVTTESPQVDITGIMMKDVLTRKTQALLTLDRTFKLDIAVICGMQGPAGEHRLSQAALNCLPDVNNDMTIQESTIKLANLGASPLFHFVGKGGQGKLTMLRGLLASILKDQRPAFHKDLGDFTKQCALRLAFFAKTKILKDGKELVIYGKVAVDSMFEQVKFTVESKETYDIK
eukprot:9924592-Lingulodinium_polyedra.AAC.1